MKKLGFHVIGLLLFFGSGVLFSEESTLPKQSGTLVNDSFYLYGDFLWWRADTSGIELAVQEKQTLQDDALFTSREVVELEGKWKPGFRVGLGYRFHGFDNWNFFFTWTHYRGRIGSGI